MWVLTQVVGCDVAVRGRQDWMLTTPELQGRIFRDCLKPGLIAYGLTLAPYLFQRATRCPLLCPGRVLLRLGMGQRKR